MECAQRSNRFMFREHQVGLHACNQMGPYWRGFIRTEMHGLQWCIQGSEFRFDCGWSVPRGEKEVGEKPKELQGNEGRLRPSDSTSHAPIQDKGCLVPVLREDPHDRRLSAVHWQFFFCSRGLTRTRLS